MALTVGNLLNDPLANSFVALDYANQYVTDEAIDGQRKAANIWLDLDTSAKEATLVKASRFLATQFKWTSAAFTEAGLIKLANVAVRLAVSSITIDLNEAINTQRQKQSVKAGSVSVAYAQSSLAVHAAGLHWPWLLPALEGLITSSRNRLGVLVV